MATPLDEAIRRILETLTEQYGLSMQAATPFARKVIGGLSSEAKPIVGEELVKARRWQDVVDRPQRLQMQQRMNPGAPVIPGGPQRRSPAWDKFFGSLQIAELEAAARGQKFGVDLGGFGTLRHQDLGSGKTYTPALGEVAPGLLPLREREAYYAARPAEAAAGAAAVQNLQGRPYQMPARAAAEAARLMQQQQPQQSAGAATTARSAPVAQAPIMAGIGQTLTYQQLRALEEELVRQTLRQAEARTKGLETEARLADPLEQVKAAATARAFQQRRDVGVVMPGENQIRPARGIRALTEEAPEHVVKGITLTDQQMPIAALREDAEAFRDPNFQAAMRYREAEAMTQGSPSVTRAMIEQQTAARRAEAAQILQAAKDAAALQRVETEQGGAGSRAQVLAATQQAIAAARSRIDVLRARTEAERYGGWGGMDAEADRLLAEAEEALRRLETAANAPVAVPAPSPIDDPLGIRARP